MNATELLRTVPLGALIAYSDGTPRPPERFTKKLSAWKEKNGTGLLINKQAGSNLAGGYSGRASFTLRVGEFGSASVIVMRVNKTYDETSALDFTVLQEPTGMIRLSRSGELVPPQDIAERPRRGYADPQDGETEQPAGYGAGWPSPLQPGDEQVLDLPGVKTFIRHRILLENGSGGTLIAVRDDGYHVEFPGTFARAIVATLDTMLDDRARRFLLGLLKRREDGEALTADDLKAVTVC